MSLKQTYKIHFVGNEIKDGHANYQAKVMPSSSETFHIEDRYSSMRDFWNKLKKDAPNNRQVPDFPPKKWFGNTKPDFVNSRQQQLQQFFSTTLEIPELSQLRLVTDYLKTKKKMQSKKKKSEKQEKQESEEQKIAIETIETTGPKPQLIDPEKLCEKIVDETSKLFIDLNLGQATMCLDDIMQKEKIYKDSLRGELNNKFTYKTKLLTLPEGRDTNLYSLMDEGEEDSGKEELERERFINLADEKLKDITHILNNTHQIYKNLCFIHPYTEDYS
jgi:hypothetical protein